MKFICLFLISITLSLLALNSAYSSEAHKSIIIVESSTMNVQPVMEMRGIASAIASSQHNFDRSTRSFQGSVGIGSYGSDTAFSFGLAKRFKDTLINGNLTQENGKYGGGVGIGWHF